MIFCLIHTNLNELATPKCSPQCLVGISWKKMKVSESDVDNFSEVQRVKLEIFQRVRWEIKIRGDA